MNSKLQRKREIITHTKSCHRFVIDLSLSSLLLLSSFSSEKIACEIGTRKCRETRLVRGRVACRKFVKEVRDVIASRRSVLFLYRKRNKQDVARLARIVRCEK